MMQKGRFIMVKKEINFSEGLSEEQIEMLRNLEKRPIVYDEDCPELSEEELSQFRHISEINNNKRRKQTISLRLSSSALEKARSLGKGYTSILSRMLEAALNDNDMIKRFL